MVIVILYTDAPGGGKENNCVKVLQFSHFLILARLYIFGITNSFTEATMLEFLNKMGQYNFFINRLRYCPSTYVIGLA